MRRNKIFFLIKWYNYPKEIISDMEADHKVFSQRKITKNYRSVTGSFPSVKNKSSIAFESLLERSLFLTLEFDNSVETYIEQPQLKIDYDGSIRTYSADCLIKYCKDTLKKETIVEVKYLTEINKDKEKFEQKFKSIQASVEYMGMEFILYTDETFPKSYIENLDFLYRYKTQSLDTRNDEKILDFAKEPMTAFQLANLIAQSKMEYLQVANAIWSLVSNGKLCTDFYQDELTMNSLVWINHERY